MCDAGVSERDVSGVSLQLERRRKSVKMQACPSYVSGNTKQEEKTRKSENILINIL